MQPDNPPSVQRLVDSPEEKLQVEYKRWLDLGDAREAALLARAILALGNSGGGWVVLGFTDSNGTLAPDTERRNLAVGYTVDAVHSIIKKYVEPPIEVSLMEVHRSDRVGPFVVCGVPGGHAHPLLAKRGSPNNGKTLVAGRPYIRRIECGPSSAEPSTLEDWRGFIRRMVRADRTALLADFRAVLEVPRGNDVEAEVGKEMNAFLEDCRQRWRAGFATAEAGNHQQDLRYGSFEAAYRLIDGRGFDKAANLRDALVNAEAPMDGWPLWMVFARGDLEPKPMDGGIETRVDDDFWRANVTGSFYHVRPHLEDLLESRGRIDIKPGEVMSDVLQMQLVAQTLAHADHVASVVEADAFEVSFRWTGLKGRSLENLEFLGRGSFHGRNCAQSEFQVRRRIERAHLAVTMTDHVHAIVAPLDELFSFYVLPSTRVASAVARARGAP